MNNLASVLSSQGKYEEAEEMRDASTSTGIEGNGAGQRAS